MSFCLVLRTDCPGLFTLCATVVAPDTNATTYVYANRMSSHISLGDELAF